jgi:hypothetical protein
VTFDHPTRTLAAWVLVVVVALLVAWPGSRD